MSRLPGANHIADCILATARLDSDTKLDRLQLNKLCYLVNGFTLREREEPAFYNDVEAWRFGPVVPEVYTAYKDYGDNPITALDMCRTSLEDRAAVGQRFITSDLTRLGRPDRHRSRVSRSLPYGLCITTPPPA